MILLCRAYKKIIKSHRVLRSHVRTVLVSHKMEEYFKGHTAICYVIDEGLCCQVLSYQIIGLF